MQLHYQHCSRQNLRILGKFFLILTSFSTVRSVGGFGSTGMSTQEAWLVIDRLFKIMDKKQSGLLDLYV